MFILLFAFRFYIVVLDYLYYRIILFLDNGRLDAQLDERLDERLVDKLDRRLDGKLDRKLRYDYLVVDLINQSIRQASIDQRLCKRLGEELKMRRN